MNASEFEIGDLVYDNEQKIRKVIGIRMTDSTNGNVEVMNVWTHLHSEHKDSTLSPIPLTSGFIESNGFRRLRGSGYYYNEELGMEIFPDGDEFKVYVSGYLVTVHSVHQLQHLIRFIGRPDFVNGLYLSAI